MSETLLQSASVRSRQIHALERAADDQRETLRLHAVGVATGVRDSEFVQNALSSYEKGRTLIESFQAGQGMIKNFFGRHQRGESDRSKFPWASGLAMVTGVLGVVRWWRQRE